MSTQKASICRTFCNFYPHHNQRDSSAILLLVVRLVVAIAVLLLLQLESIALAVDANKQSEFTVDSAYNKLTELLGNQVDTDRMYVDGKLLKVEGLAVSVSENADASMEILAKLPPSLRDFVHRIDLSDLKMSERGAKSIGKLSELRSLSVKRWDDDWTCHLKPLQKLQELWIHKAGITEKSIQGISELKSLTVLMAAGNDFKSGGLEPLGNLVNLQQLSLSSPLLVDGDFVFLEKLDKLTALLLRGTSISDGGIKHIFACKDLSLLQLRSTKVTQKGAAQLAKRLEHAIISADD